MSRVTVPGRKPIYKERKFRNSATGGFPSDRTGIVRFFKRITPDSITGNQPEGVIVIKEEKTRKDVSLVEKGLNHTREEHEQASICSICTKPATQLVDGDPSCDEHVEQVYEHQVEDYTVRHLVDNEWRKV